MKTSLIKRVSVFVLTLVILAASLNTIALAAPKYKDVPDGKWFSEAISFVSEKGYFSGTGNGIFSPNSNMTRAMFVQVLAAASGDDIASYDTDSYSDVPAGKWYSHSVAWAEKTGVASGVANGIFSPDSNITRESVCLMLVKIIEYKSLVPREVSKDNAAFADNAKIASWSKSAVEKVRTWGMIGGKPGNMFDPKGNATRAELAVIIMKLDEAMNKAYKIKVKNIDVVIPGLEKEYSFLHMSDLHLTLTDDTDPETAKYNQAARGAAFLKETGSDIKQEERFDDHMAFAKEKDVDFIAMTGDIIDAPSNGNINRVAAAVKDFGKETLFLLGNHDWTGDWIGEYQSNNQRSNSIPKFIESGIMLADEDYILVREYDEFVIIGIDDSNDQITFAEYSTVQKYINKRKPIILMLHVPLDIETLQADATAKWGRPILLGNPVLSPNNNTKMFVNMIKAPNSTVVAVFAGHVHFDHEDIINEYTGAKQYTLGASLNGDCALVKIHG